jgi:hypothetical protein
MYQRERKDTGCKRCGTFVELPECGKHSEPVALMKSTVAGKTKAAESDVGHYSPLP